MEPFRLACPHCASKIVVRHEPLLGQTLPCPKCKGAILVPAAPPVGSESTPFKSTTAQRVSPAAVPQPPQRVGPHVINSGAITKEGDPDWENMLASENFTIPVDTENDSTLRFRPLSDSDNYALAPIESTPIPFNPLPTPTDPTPLHKQPWQSNSVAKRRQILTLVMIAITGSLVAIGCFVAFMKMVGNDRKSISAGNDLATSVPKNATAVIQDQGTDEAAKSDPEAIAQPNTTTDPDRVETAQPTGTPEIVETEEPKVAIPEEKKSDSSQALATTPLPNAITPPASIPTIEEDDNSSVALPPIFGQLLGEVLGKGNSIPDAGFGKNELADELDVQNAELYIDQVFHPQAKAVPSWEEKSKLQLRSLTIKDTNFLRCIDSFGRMTGVGITVDWQSCRIAGIELTKPLQLDSQGKSVAELVAEIVENMGLEWTLDKQGLPVISASRAAMESKLPLDWSVPDLFAEGFEQQSCDALLRLWGYEDVCGFSSGRLQWNERATPIEKANVQASLNALASLRKLRDDHPWQPKKEIQAVFSPDQWYSSLAALNRQVGMSVIIPEPRPVADLLMTAAKATELNVCIDWQNAWNHGLIPNKPATSVLRGRTFPQIANRFLTDYALDLIPISEDSFWITTGDVRRKMVRVVPIRIPKDLKLEELKQSLRLIAPLGPDDRSRFKVIPIPGTTDLFWARVCSPRADQVNDPDLILSFGWQ